MSSKDDSVNLVERNELRSIKPGFGLGSFILVCLSLLILMGLVLSLSDDAEVAAHVQKNVHEIK